MRSRAILWLCLLPAGAFANGAMGLGLEMWDLRYWFAYVLIMIVGEALLIGRPLGFSFAKCLFISSTANFVTGFLCGGLGLLAPLLHGAFVGTRANPNPLLNSVALLLIFAIPSALFENGVWGYFLCRAELAADRRTLWRSVWVHLVLVPVGLAILLIPDRPYRGLEGTTSMNLRHTFRKARAAVQSFIDEKGRIPSASTIPELRDELAKSGQLPGDVDFVAALTSPHFARFSTGGDRGVPFEVNLSIRGKKVGQAPRESWTWYLRPREESPFERQIEVDLGSGRTASSSNGHRSTFW